MKLLIEEYQYDTQTVVNILEGLFTLQNVDGKISVSYVGYYFNPKIKDCVFILPKVLIDENGKIFGRYAPTLLINLDEARLESHELKFLYEFAVWIHRAIVVFLNDHPKNEIVLQKTIENEGNGIKKKSNSLLDIILALLRFNKENRSFFTFILKNIHSEFNKINWCKTISSTTAVVQGSEPIYLNPINKKHQINFDEELIIIFFSILKYVSDHFGFCTEIPFGFKLITGAQFERYISGYGRRRLRQIKYKYFSDIAVRLWELCYTFFDKTYRIKASASQSEYLLVKSFYIVFEAIIEELIGDNDVPTGLKEQADGKLVDHFYTYDGLIVDKGCNNDIYYIGDSKYYKIGNDPGKESVYKQYTYARNVIQWNLNLFLNPQNKEEEKDRYQTIQLRDNVTEGYNVIPNFFISANIDPLTLTYEDKTEPHKTQPPISCHFSNRLYDRDTLLLSHYDVNFLFVLSLYARNNSGAKTAYKQSVRRKFRKAVQTMLCEHFDFYALQAHPGVQAEKYFKNHFQETLGKTFRPFENKEVFSLALDKTDPKNDELLDKLRKNFYVVACPLGEVPTALIEQKQQELGITDSPAAMDGGKFLTCLIRKEEKGKDKHNTLSKLYQLFYNHKTEGATYVMLNMPSGDISEAKYLLPIIDNGIDGYYNIETISFGSRTKTLKGNNVEMPVKLPTLRIKIGAFHSFDKRYTEGIVPHMANQIWNYSQLQKLMNKNHSYASTEHGINLSIANEPELEYEKSDKISSEMDYIESLDNS